MSDFIRKRKSTAEDYDTPNKSLKDKHPGPRNFNQPAGLGTLPSLPQADDRYKSLVFIHPSQNSASNCSYDRLEFLGDAYLELFATQLIFQRFPTMAPGRMSQVRESLVRNETIGQYATLYGLDKQLKNYKSFQNQSPLAWLKIKGDLFESYVAAVVLSSPDGPDVAKKWLHQLWEPKMEASAAMPTSSKKSKEDLAKKIAGKGVKINYVDEKDPIIHYGQGKETYFVGVYLTGWGWDNQYLGSGKGLSRVEAGQNAAAAALDNHPLIDDIAAKRAEMLAQRDKEAA